MQDYITDGVTWKDIEQLLFRYMQKEYGQLLQQVLEDIDRTLAEKRDKNDTRSKINEGYGCRRCLEKWKSSGTITSIGKNGGMSVCWMLFFSLRGHMESVRC